MRSRKYGGGGSGRRTRRRSRRYGEGRRMRSIL